MGFSSCGSYCCWSLSDQRSRILIAFDLPFLHQDFAESLIFTHEIGENYSLRAEKQFWYFCAESDLAIYGDPMLLYYQAFMFFYGLLR